MTRIKVYPDGREVADRAECQRRTVLMWQRQNGMCCYQLTQECRKYPYISLAHAVFAHEHCRGMGGGKRDDRIEVNGQRQNGASCWACNSFVGSRNVPMHKGEKQ